MLLDFSVLQHFVRSPTRFTFSHAEKAISPPSKCAPSTLHFVPDELIEEVLSHCSQSTLRQLSLCDWRLNRLVGRFLYQDIRFSSPDKMLIFFITVCMQPYLARHVRTLDVEHSLCKVMMDSPFSESIFARRLRKLGSRRINNHKHVLKNVLTLVNTALKSMVNLISLNLTMPDGDVHAEYSSLLSGVEFQLLHFHSSIRINRDIIVFLSKQSLLQDLKVHSTFPLENAYLEMLPPTSMRSLEALSWSSRTSMEVVQAFLQDRPVKKVTINLYPGTAFSKAVAVGPGASKQITTINLAFRDQSRPSAAQLKVLATAFPNMTSLGLSLLALSQGTVQQLTEALASFGQLEELSLFTQREVVERTELISLTKTWFALSKSLRVVVFNVSNASPVTERMVRRSSSNAND